MNDADRAKQYLSEHGLARRTLEAKDGRVCMMGAIARTQGIPLPSEGLQIYHKTVQDPMQRVYDQLNSHPLTHALALIIEAEYPEIFVDVVSKMDVELEPSQFVGTFNDRPDTTQEMAERVFEKASAWLDEQI